MPSNPSPTPSPPIDPAHAVAPAGGRGFPLEVFANFSRIEPAHGSEHNEDLTLSVLLVICIPSTATTGYEFQLTLGSQQGSSTGAHGLAAFSFPPGTYTSFYLEVDHPHGVHGTFDLEVMVLAAPVGTGNYRQIALYPAIGEPAHTYAVT